MSAAELFRWPVTKWTHPCGNFIASTAGAQRFCATCSFERHAHKPKEKTVTPVIRCTFCIDDKPATWKCDCGSHCEVYACDRHKGVCAKPVKMLAAVQP